jgi:hypothetical protein
MKKIIRNDELTEKVNEEKERRNHKSKTTSEDEDLRQFIELIIDIYLDQENEKEKLR